MSGDAAKFEGKVKLESFEITRREGKPKAEVDITIDGEKKTGIGYGDGPVDASYHAIKDLLNDEFELEEYKLDSITGDTDAQAQVVVVIEKSGQRYIGRGQSTDIVEASIIAYINGINRLYKY